MGRHITRRDFISGVAVGVGAVAASGPSAFAGASPQPAAASPQVSNRYYPPRLTGLRGQHAGSFESAHRARDGAYRAAAADDADTGERYDLVVVGGGISGLSAAYFFRKALGDQARVLVLDNHDDFGGHAKRNEFTHEGRLYIGYGGTQSISTPFPYSFLAKSLVDDLGIDVSRYRQFVNRQLYEKHGLARGIFFDKATFGKDVLLKGLGARPWAELFAEAPLAPEVRADLVRIHTEKRDYMPSLDAGQKAEALKRISYQDYLLQHAKITPAAMPFFAATSFRNNMRVDTCPAYIAARGNSPGFAGMHIAFEPTTRGGEYTFHFPDGNASVARLLVNRLVPQAWDGPQTMESISLANVRYEQLDTDGASVRLRLNSTVVRVEHEGAAGRATSALVSYVAGGRTYTVRGGNVILACFNNIIPHIVPALPAAQKAALGYASKVPLMYTNVFVRNWQPWVKLGVQSISAPNGYHTSASLDMPVSIGGYRCPVEPDEPIVLHMTRSPNKPGIPRKEQHRAGRAEMLATSFDKIEFAIRDQLARMLGPGGFDPAADILGITANRWPHGYAYTYDTLGDPDVPPAERPHVIGRMPFGRIAIANADAGAAAFTNTAIDEAHRAVQDCLASRGLL